MPDILFNSISSNYRVPGQYVEFSSSRALLGLPTLPSRALIIAPRLTTGTVAAATPFLITSGAAGTLGFGYGSVGSLMAQAFVKANPYTELWGIGVADAGGGTAATGQIVFAGTATAAGTLAVYVGGILVAVPVAVGDTATTQGDSFVTALGLIESPLTAVNTTGTVALTARNKGTTGNDIDIRVNMNQGDTVPAGVTTPAITKMASGATDGSVSGAVTAMAAVQYNTVCSAWRLDADLDLIEAELLTRWGPMVQLEGHLFAATGGPASSDSSVGSMATYGNARNSFNSTVMGIGSSPTPTFVWAAVVGAVAAYQYSINPFRPFTTLPLPGCLPPAKASVIVASDRNTLLHDGISTYTVDAAGTCLIERLITTYQTTNSVADPSFLDLTTPRGIAALRYTQRARVALKWPRAILADDGEEFGPGQPIVTPSIVKSELISLYKDWADAAWVSKAGLAQFKADLVVQRNSTDNTRIDVLQDPEIVSGFLIYAAQIQFLLQAPKAVASA